MAMSDNKSNVCGLKQCGNINYMFQSHCTILKKGEKIHHICKTFSSGMYPDWSVKPFSSYAINVIKDADQPGGWIFSFLNFISLSIIKLKTDMQTGCAPVVGLFKS